MPGTTRTRGTFLPALLAALLLATAAASAARVLAPRVTKAGSLYVLASGSSRYHFDAAWRTESLWTTAEDGTLHRIAYPDAATLDRFRRMFLVQIGREAVGEVPVEGEAELASLRSLGYI